MEMPYINSLLFASGVIAGCGITLLVASLVLPKLKARHEEKLLLRQHVGYAEYVRRTWGVVPFLRG